MKYGWLFLALLLPLPLTAQVGGRGAAASAATIAGGTFRPLYGQPGESDVSISSFQLDTRPVTRAEFESFVQQHPQWQRGRAPALFVDDGYLRDWAGAADAGSAIARDVPVTGVSWFAARAYCRAQGGRLPSTNEWEYAALADESDARAGFTLSFRQRALELALGRRVQRVGSGFRNVWGVSDLHGGVMEWVNDFQSIFAGSDSRATSKHERAMTCAAGATTTGDASDYAAFLRYAYRASLEGRTTTGTMGFRCAWSTEQ